MTRVEAARFDRQQFDEQRHAETIKIAFRGENSVLRSAVGVDVRTN
jgi:hypothetical protein